MSMTSSKFKTLLNLDIRGDVEQDYKGLNYLSWASAYQLMMEQDPEATYNILKAPDGLPFFSRDGVHMVYTEVTMFGVTKEMFLPVMDNKKNAVKVPTSRDVADNIMRCLVKNIAMFGIGLRLYKKEGLDEFQADDAVLNLIAQLMKELNLSKSQLEELAIQTFGKDNIRLLTKDEAEDMVHTLKKIRRQRQLHLSNETSVTPNTTVESATGPIDETKLQAVQTPTESQSQVEENPQAEMERVETSVPAPGIEIQVESPTAPVEPAPSVGDKLTSDQFNEITSLYHEKKLTKNQLKEEILGVAPEAKGVKSLTPKQAEAVIEKLKSIA